MTHPQVMATYPSLATVVVLVMTTRHSLQERVGAPATLLDNYSRELERAVATLTGSDER